jgi:hypothetical protein
MSSKSLAAYVVLLGVLFLHPRESFSRPVIFEEPLSPRIANYDMEVSLDADTGILTGRETLTWHNKTADAADELQFHLYLNAFRNNRSSFMKEAGEKAYKKLKKDGWGYIEVGRIALADGREQTDEMEFIHPDDDNADDRTVFRLPLPKPLLPGETIVLHIDFTARLPSPPVARNGSKKEYFFFAQWFPKIGVYEHGKWNCHQYHSHGEFYADFGVYNVKITVPEKNVVGATGIEVERKNNGDGTATHSYHAEDVHDFTWTASPKFVEFTGRAQDVEIRVLMQKAHARQGPRHLAAAKLAVEYFQDWYGDYPYPNLTVVDPTGFSDATGGMEYPTLITAGTMTGMPQGVLAPEMVIIHEFGHNFWYHLVANNETEEAWLDEGVTTYCEIRIMEDIYGKGSMIDIMGIEVENMYMRRYSYVVAPDLDPTIKNSWEYYSGNSYRSMAYSKPALMLMTLENHIGTETMREILRTYFERYKFKHPKTEDFIEVANQVSGQDLSWFFDQMLYSNAVLDYSVDYVFSKEAPEGKGYDYTLSADSADVQLDQAKRDSGPMYLSKVKIRRLGQFRFPVEVEIVFEDGEIIRETWDGEELWKEYRYTRSAKLNKATVDPDNKTAADINYLNNEKTLRQQRREDKKPGGGTLDMIKYALDPQ